MQRLLILCLLMRLLAAPAPSARAADRAAEPDKAVLRVAFGVLQKHKTSAGDDQYVLVDKDGQIRYSIDAGHSKNLPLEANLGKSVQVVGKYDSPPSSDKPLLVAQAIEPNTAPPGPIFAPGATPSPPTRPGRAPPTATAARSPAAAGLVRTLASRLRPART